MSWRQVQASSVGRRLSPHVSSGQERVSKRWQTALSEKLQYIHRPISQGPWGETELAARACNETLAEALSTETTGYTPPLSQGTRNATRSDGKSRQQVLLRSDNALLCVGV